MREARASKGRRTGCDDPYIFGATEPLDEGGVMNYTDDSDLPEVADETLMAALEATTPFTIVVLKAGPKFFPPGPDRDPDIERTIWEHG
jgi:hypothetical protein